jgi:hypothetical protein
VIGRRSLGRLDSDDRSQVDNKGKLTTSGARQRRLVVRRWPSRLFNPDITLEKCDRTQILVLFIAVYLTGRRLVTPRGQTRVTRSSTLPCRPAAHPHTVLFALLRKLYNGVFDKLTALIGDASSPNSPQLGFLRFSKFENKLVSCCKRNGWSQGPSP